MVKGLAKNLGTAYAMTRGSSMLTQASSSEERLLPNDEDMLTIYRTVVDWLFQMKSELPQLNQMLALGCARRLQLNKSVTNL